MATTQLTLFGSNARQIKPYVVNLFSNNNNVDRLEFQMENYNQDNVDLSTLDAYAICYGKEFLGGLDEVKLESEVTADGILKIYWDLTIMSLTESQTITYQIVFKNDEGAVWTSYKAVLNCNGSLTADEEIVAQYPTILKQMEKRIEVKTDEATQGAVEEITNTVADTVNDAMDQINDMAGNFDAGVIYIPYGEHVPVEERISNRLYYQYTNAENTKGRFEDYMGNVLVAEGSGGGGSSLPMFAPIWSDHLYNDASYLRADNFSWHNSTIYISAYAKLLEQYNNENSVEMVDGDITYKLTPDGFKIANASQHDNVRLAYENDSKSWFYLLDVENARFKLPREKKTDGKYLYFYVGYYERPATEVNIGILTEIANGQDLSEILGEVEIAKNQAIAEIQTSGVAWGSITGTLSDQTDLQTVLNTKANVGDIPNVSSFITISDVEAKDYATVSDVSSSSTSLQTQINILSQQVVALQSEIKTMLGRMDFANSITFKMRQQESYTCPSDGYVQFTSADGVIDDYYIKINDVNFCTYRGVTEGSVGLIPVSKGDVIKSYNSSYYLYGTFIPQKGV